MIILHDEHEYKKATEQMSVASDWLEENGLGREAALIRGIIEPIKFTVSISDNTESASFDLEIRFQHSRNAIICPFTYKKSLYFLGTHAIDFNYRVLNSSSWRWLTSSSFRRIKLKPYEELSVEIPLQGSGVADTTQNRLNFPPRLP